MSISSLKELGFPPEADQYLSTVRLAEQRELDRATTGEIPDPALAWVRYGGAGSMYHNSAMSAYLLQDFFHAREFALKAIAAYDDYFFGDWRSEVPTGNHRDFPPDENWHRLNKDWREQWWAAIHWSSAFNDWGRVERLLAYPNVDLLKRLRRQVEKHVVALSWPILVGLSLSGREAGEIEALHDVIIQSKQKNEQLLLPVLEGVLEGSIEMTTKEIEDYLNWFRRARRPRKTFNDKLSIEAGFLKNYAEYASLNVSLSECNEDLVVQPQLLSS